ncbi:neutral zinc metallopeptidase [Streptosporangium sandarakinum]|uniref:neutral zinc metallopeptidase n=1 Tax=Streptosporangium sandarakinum TaxID=1260955 RepID=UPI00341F0F61
MSTFPFRQLSSLVVAPLAFGLVMATGTAEAATVTAPAAGAAATTATTAAATVKAPPRGRTAATANPLYRTGLLPNITCAAGEIRAGSAASYRAFMTRVNRCLNLAWKTQFRKAGLSFAQPRLRFTTTKVGSPCGRWPGGAGGYYCSSNRTIYIGVFRSVLKQPYAPNNAQFMAHEYAHHVQQLAGIMGYYGQTVWRAGASAKLAYSRRLELQADCMGAAFLRQISDDLPVPQDHWDAMIRWTVQNGQKVWPTNDHGKGRSQAYWLNRGFNSGSPSSCNTWTASSARVA